MPLPLFQAQLRYQIRGTIGQKATFEISQLAVIEITYLYGSYQLTPAMTADWLPLAPLFVCLVDFIHSGCAL